MSQGVSVRKSQVNNNIAYKYFKTFENLFVAFTLPLKSMDGRKRSLNLIGPGRGQRPPVFLFYNIYIYI